MLTLSDLQYVLNTIPAAGYQKAFNNKAPFFGHLPLVTGKGGNIAIPYHYAGNAGGGSFTEEDELSSGGKQARRTIHFPWKSVYKKISVSGLSQAVSRNGGVLNINDQVKDEAKNAVKDLISMINTQLMGDGTGNSGKDIQGVKYHIADSGDYANEALSRSVYTWLASYVSDNGGVARALTEELINAVHNELVDNRGVNYTQVWTNSTLAYAYEKLMGDKKRYMNVKVGDVFMDALMIHGRPVIPFPGYPARMDFVEADGFEIQYLPVDSKDSLGREVKSGLFKVKELPTSKDAEEAAIICYLNLVCKNAYHHGSLQDIQ